MEAGPLDRLADGSFNAQVQLMTRLLQRAFDKVGQLPAQDQDAIAAMILEELGDEESWEDAFSRSQALLGKMAAEVREDIRAGRVQSKGIDEL
jgi:hypothetical protein